MGLVRGAGKVDHAVEAGKGRAIALVTVAIEFLLGENVSTALERHSQLAMRRQGRGRHGGQRAGVGRALKYLAGEGDHGVGRAVFNVTDK